MSSIVISGLGVVGAFGAGRAAWAEALAAAVPRWSEVDRSVGFHRPGGVRLAGCAAGVDLGPWLGAAARRMSPPSKLATAAARMAIDDAGAEPDTEAATATAVVMATSYGPSSFTESILSQIFQGGGPQTVSPALFTESVANAAAAQVAIACQARGTNLTVTEREAGGLIGLGLGLRELRLGRARRVIVGAVDEITPLLHAVLDRMGVLAGSRQRPGVHAVTPREVARPFDRRRDGFVLAEGAAALVLESEEDASRRGARVLARLRATAAAFDPEAPRTGFGRDPARLAAVLGRAFERWGLVPEDVDAIVSGAAGSRTGDRLEALVLRRVWGERALPTVFAPKATTGEQLGGFLSAAVLAAAGAPFGATPGFAELDPELGVVPHDGRPCAAPRRVLATALAAGGAAAWAILERAET